MQLLACIADLLAAANWQRGGDPNAPRPEKIPRPGVEGFAQTVGSVDDEDDAYTIAELEAMRAAELSSRPPRSG